MKKYRKGSIFHGYRVVSLLDTLPWRMEYAVVPVDKANQGEFRTIVYDLADMPCELVWFAREWSSDPIVSLENRFLNDCRHAAFPEVVANGEDGKLQWMVIKLKGGISVWDYVRETGPLHPVRAVRAVIDLCTAVETLAAFEGEPIHCNISPMTVRIVRGKNAPMLFLEGFSCLAEEREDAVWQRPIRPSSFYVAPEQFVGQLNGKADVFGISMVLYELLTGKYPWDLRFSPFEAVLAEECSLEDFIIGMSRVWKAEPDLAEIELPALHSVLLKGLSTDPNLRFMNVSLLKEKLEQILLILGEEDGKESVCRKEDGPARGFAAVAGLRELKEQMKYKFVLPVRHPELAEAYRITAPNGCLLYGPPGCGKTYVARHISDEAGLPCRVYKPSDIASIYVHGGQVRIRSLFEEMLSQAPLMVCFDEADAFFADRSAPGRGQYAGEVNEFLTWLNNAAEKGLYVFLMTNNPDLIDSAILRTGRVDEKFYVPMPDAMAREEFFRIRLHDIPAAEVTDIHRLSVLSEGMTFSDLDYVIKESCRIVFRQAVEQQIKEVLPVSQSVLEDVIAGTLHSVSPEDLRRYEKMRDEFQRKGKAKLRIGFA